MEISLEPIGIVFSFIVVGFLCRKLDIISVEQVRGLSFFAMNVALPCVILKSFARIDLAEIFDIRIYLSYFPIAIVVFGLGWLVAKFILKKEPTHTGLLAMGSCFANLGLVGMPLIEATWGEHGIAVLAIILSIHPVLMMSVPIAVIECTSKHEDGRKWWVPFTRLLKNTIILSVILGGFISLAKIEIPPSGHHFLQMMSGAAGPCALFSVGAFLAQARFRSSLSSLYAAVFKVILMPCLVYSVARFAFGVTGEVLMILTFIGGLPTGANASVLSQYYRSAEAEISSVVSAATLFSLLSLPAIVWLLN